MDIKANMQQPKTPKQFTSGQLKRIETAILEENIRVAAEQREKECERDRQREREGDGEESEHEEEIRPGWVPLHIDPMRISALLSMQDIKRHPRSYKIPRGQYFPFLDLPTEIRNMIYENLLVVGKVFPYPKMDDQRCEDMDKYDHPELQLLRVNKQIFEESAPIFFSKNKFVLAYGKRDRWPHAWPLWDLPNRNRPEQYDLPVSAMVFKHLKQLNISFDSRDVEITPNLISSWRAEEIKRSPGFGDLPEREQWVRFNEQYEYARYEFWVQRNELLHYLKLDLLEVDLTDCYSSLSFQRAAGDVWPFIAKSNQDNPPKHIIVYGLKGRKEGWMYRMGHKRHRRLNPTAYLNMTGVIDESPEEAYGHPSRIDWDSLDRDSEFDSHESHPPVFYASEPGDFDDDTGHSDTGTEDSGNGPRDHDSHTWESDGDIRERHLDTEESDSDTEPPRRFRPRRVYPGQTAETAITID